MILNNPFKRFEGKELTPNIASWPRDFDLEVFHEVVGKSKPIVIFELGTFLGYSIINMLDECEKFGLNTAAVCIDTWLGGSDHFINYDRGSDDLFFRFFDLAEGTSKLFDQFCVNIVSRGYQNRVTALANTTDNAFEYLKYIDAKADLIYVDAAHLKFQAYRDISNYYELLNDGGIMFGHDINWKDIQEAVDEFCFKNNLRYITYHNKFWEIVK